MDALLKRHRKSVIRWEPPLTQPEVKVRVEYATRKSEFGGAARQLVLGVKKTTFQLRKTPWSLK